MMTKDSHGLDRDDRQILIEAITGTEMTIACLPGAVARVSRPRALSLSVRGLATVQQSTTAQIGRRLVLTDAGRELARTVALEAGVLPGRCPHPDRNGRHETYLNDRGHRGQISCRACGETAELPETDGCSLR